MGKSTMDDQVPKLMEMSDGLIYSKCFEPQIVENHSSLILVLIKAHFGGELASCDLNVLFWGF